MTPTLVVLVALLFGIVIGALRMSYRMQAAEREILQYLGNGGEWYGLELVQASEAKRGAIRRGTVYVILNSLEDRELVVSRIPPAPGIELVSWPVLGREDHVTASVRPIGDTRRLYRLASVAPSRVDTPAES